MRAYACAREGVIVDIFTLRKTLFGMGSSSIVFSASERPLKTTRHFPQNDTSFSLKQAVVFIKTSRRFMSKNRLLNPNQSFEMEGGAEVKQLTLF